MDDRIDRTARSPLLLFAKLYLENGEPIIRAFYPTDYDEHQLNVIKKYTFPFDQSKGSATLPQQETFTFIITRENGKYNFGYCLIKNDLSNNTSTVHCILSTLPWKKKFYDILRHLVKLPATEAAALLQKLRNSSMPTLRQPLEIVKDRLILAPDVYKHDSISPDETIHLYMLKQCMDPLLLIEVFVSLLFERRIILKSNSLGTLTDLCAALESLLYPFKWQSIYIIPLHIEMLDYCHAPTPYLIGVHSSIYQRLLDEVGRTIIDENISILDIDKKAFYSNTKVADMDLIPKKIMKELESNLKSWEIFCKAEIKNAFATCQARLLSKYTCGWSNGESFNKDDYIESHTDPAMRIFAEHIVQVQMFEQFIMMKEENRKRYQGFDRFDLQMQNLPEIKSKMDDAKKLFNGILDKGKREFNKNKINDGRPRPVIKTREINLQRNLENVDNNITETPRPKRTPPPVPPPPNCAKVKPSSLIDFSSPTKEVSSPPLVESLLVEDQFTDNYSILNNWTRMSLSAEPAIKRKHSTSGTMRPTSWLHSNLKKNSDIDQFDPLK